MEFAALTRSRVGYLFAVSAAVIYTAVFLITRNTHAHVVQTAAIVDLTITTAAAFYFLLVRPGHAGWFFPMIGSPASSPLKSPSSTSPYSRGVQDPHRASRVLAPAAMASLQRSSSSRWSLKEFRCI
jgi:hypothetical protein